MLSNDLYLNYERPRLLCSNKIARSGSPRSEDATKYRRRRSLVVQDAASVPSSVAERQARYWNRTSSVVSRLRFVPLGKRPRLTRKEQKQVPRRPPRRPLSLRLRSGRAG